MKHTRAFVYALTFSAMAMAWSGCGNTIPNPRPSPPAPATGTAVEVPAQALEIWVKDIDGSTVLGCQAIAQNKIYASPWALADSTGRIRLDIAQGQTAISIHVTSTNASVNGSGVAVFVDRIFDFADGMPPKSPYIVRMKDTP